MDENEPKILQCKKERKSDERTWVAKCFDLFAITTMGYGAEVATMLSSAFWLLHPSRLGIFYLNFLRQLYKCKSMRKKYLSIFSSDHQFLTDSRVTCIFQFISPVRFAARPDLNNTPPKI